MRRLILGIFAAVVAAVLFIVLCTFVRRPYEAVLLERFGKLIPVGEHGFMYNWYFKLPTDTVIRIDTRLHLYTGGLQQLTTSRKEPISVRVFAAWRITDAKAFYQKTSGSDERAMSIMEARLRELVGDKLGKHTLDDLFSSDEKSPVQTGKIEDEIAQEASLGSADGKTPGLKDLGLEIAEVGFSRLAFPPSNTESVYSRMVAALNQQAQQYEAEGRRDADTILANGRKEAEQIRTDAIAESERIRGEGDRSSLQILAKVNQTAAAREFYQYWKSLDYLKASLAKNTILVLSTDSPFLKSLFALPDVKLAPAGNVVGSGGDSAGGAAKIATPAPVQIPVPGQR